ncbi:BatD family protein [Sulfurimonas paralvinellae]|nr:BatD family protein [Sulfurimonas paralvinellae]
MKKSLGRIFLIFLLFTTAIYAKQLATYKFFANKKEAVVKEAIEVTLIAHQKNKSKVMFFFATPKKSNDYKAVLLTKEIQDHSYHNTSAVFKYIIFPLKAKKIHIDFDFTIKTATDKGIAFAYVEDHDDSKRIAMEVSHVKIKPLDIRVKKLKHPVDLIGDFKLNSTIDKQSINQYENVNLHYTLLGTGYNDKVTLLKNLKDVNLFSDINNAYIKLTPEGYKIKREYIYALSAKKDFTIPAVTLHAYSPKTEKYYTLTAAQHHIKVTKIDTSKLLDNEEYPQTKELINFDALKQFLIYLIIFITGYLSAQFQSFSFKKDADSTELQEIKKAQTAKELLFILVNIHKEQQFSHEVKMLEEIVYNNAAHNFNKIKTTIIKGLK